MKINENMKLVLKDVFLYDIEACHYNILKNMGYDISEIDKDNKKERNIQIGKMMRRNPSLTSVLRKTTESIIDTYISKNEISEDDIIIRQYDGFITTRVLRETKIGDIPLNIRKNFEIFISSIDRKMYIAMDSTKKVTAKGIALKYDKIVEVYERICKINYGNKLSIFRNLQKIKDDFFNSTDPFLFSIPNKNEKFTVFIKDYGQMEMSGQLIKLMETDDIDKERYFDFYINPFTKSIVYEFVR